MSHNDRIKDTRIKSFVKLVSPEDACKNIPVPTDQVAAIKSHRNAIRNIMEGRDKRVLVIVGPCSIHDTKAGLEYARKLHTLAQEVKDQILVVMRVYFEKPRTTVGWKGLINDPELDGTNNVTKGLTEARKFLAEVATIGLPAASEFLDPYVPQYISDLVSWVAIGARTTESQTHREMASGLSMPVGFKNATDGGLQVAIDAMVSASHPHSFLGIDEKGATSVVNTEGNPDVHLILRGGNSGPNYSREHIEETLRRLKPAPGQRPIMIDCSHGNSNKDYTKQGNVFQDVIEQYTTGQKEILGTMLESNLSAGKQPLKPNDLTYGISITDGCIDWQETETLIKEAHKKLSSRS